MSMLNRFYSSEKQLYLQLSAAKRASQAAGIIIIYALWPNAAQES